LALSPGDTTVTSSAKNKTNGDDALNLLSNNVVSQPKQPDTNDIESPETSPSMDNNQTDDNSNNLLAPPTIPREHYVEWKFHETNLLAGSDA
jgi:hypothetical protein